MLNMANQAVGEQPKALAASVVAYAGESHRPRRTRLPPGDGADRAQARLARHTEYTIVGHHLVRGRHGSRRRGHLEVASAWDEVYWLFGTMLIAEEVKLYALGGTDPAQPWRKYTSWSAAKRRPMCSLALKPRGGRTADTPHGPVRGAGRIDRPAANKAAPVHDLQRSRPRRVPGDHSPRARGEWRPRRRGVDLAVRETLSSWMQLDVSQPAGDVVLDDLMPLVLVSQVSGSPRWRPCSKT